MSGFFQHLKPVEPVVTDDGLGLLRGLEDLDRHVTSQTAPRILRGDNGRVVVAPFTLPFRAADAAPYDRDYPSSGLPAVNVQARLGELVNHLEGIFDVPLVPHVLADRSANLLRGYPSIRPPEHEFEVTHLGGARWRIASGRIRGGGMDSNEQVIEGAEFTGTDVFVGFWVQLSPEVDPADAENWVFSMQASAFEVVSTWENQGPERRDDGTRYVWSPGRMFLPVAYVEAPTPARMARVVPLASGTVTFANHYFGPGLPIYS